VDKLLIEGGKVLSGEVAMSGAKNAALPILSEAQSQCISPMCRT